MRIPLIPATHSDGRIVVANTPEMLLQDEDVKEFYLGIRSEESRRGYQRWKRKKRWRRKKLSSFHYHQ